MGALRAWFQSADRNNSAEVKMSEIVTFAESLIPLIRELCHTTENDRRVAAPIVQAIRKSDLCRMLLDTGEPRDTARPNG